MPSSRTLVAALLGLICVFASADAYFTGDGTAYSGDYEKDKTGFNSCQFGQLSDRWEKYYGAIPSHMFDRSRDCGKCVRVRGTEAGATGLWIKVMIVDECASCEGDGDIDFSSRALEEITGFSWDRKLIEWEWTSCDDEEDATTSTADSSADSSADSTPDEDQSSESKKDRRRRRRRKNKSNSSRRLMEGSSA